MNVLSIKISFLLCLLFFLSGCYSGGKRQNIVSGSLLAQCERQASLKHADSLRTVAKEYMARVKPYGHDYYKAFHFLLLADFIEGGYDKVPIALDKVSRMPGFGDYPDIACACQYTCARSLQYARRYDEAIDAFEACLEYDATEDTVREEIRKTVIEALLQLMNTYQTAGQPEECVDYFRRLRANPTPVIRDYCQRDLCSLFAYSLSRTDAMGEAEQLMEQALRMPLYHSTPQRLFRDYAYAAAVFYANPKRQEQVIKWCEQAIVTAREYDNTGGVQWISSMLGTLYKRTGRMEEAVDLYLQGIAEARKRNDFAGEANAYNSLTELYLYWDLCQQANEYADIALMRNREQRDENPMLHGRSYLMKGRVMKEMGRKDSAFYFWQKADSCCRQLPYDSGMADIDNLIGGLMTDAGCSDSLQRGIEHLQKVVRYSATTGNRATAYFRLSKALFRQGKNQVAETMLDSMYALLNASQSPLYIDDAYKYALDYYLKKHDAVNVERYARGYLGEASYLFDSKVSEQVSKVRVHFYTEKKEQQLQLAKTELANKSLRVYLYQSLFVGAVMILLLIIVWVVYKRRVSRMKRRLTEQRLQNMIENLREANKRSSLLEQQLTDKLTAENVQQQIADYALLPSVLRKDGEAKFRESFINIHPTFLHALRERVPNITPHEEVLCMLIVLGETVDELADIFNIVRSSVNMARHRLRQKMQLDKDASLDEEIKRLLVP